MELSKEVLQKQLSDKQKALKEITNASNILESNRLKLIGQIELLNLLLKEEQPKLNT